MKRDPNARHFVGIDDVQLRAGKTGTKITLSIPEMQGALDVPYLESLVKMFDFVPAFYFDAKVLIQALRAEPELSAPVRQALEAFASVEVDTTEAAQ
jgi:hypothetical protein